MKRIFLSSGIALMAFALGVAVTVFWISLTPTTTIPPVVELPDRVDEAYSLTWIPSFHEPVYVRVWHSNDGAFIVAKMLDSKGWSKFGNVKAEHTRALTAFEWRNFTELLNRTSYWEQPSTVSGVLPMDGAEWIVEGVRNKRHHVVRRRVPNEQFAEICKHLIRLSGLETAHSLYLPSE